MEKLNLYLAYYDFDEEAIPPLKVEDKIKCGIEFSPKDLYQKSESTKTSLKHISEGDYEINAKVLFIAEDFWVIDFGFIAIQRSRPHNKKIKVGDFIKGRFGLSVNAWYDYLEKRSKETGIPLTYEFRIDKLFDKSNQEIEMIDEALKHEKNLMIEVTTAET